MPEITARASGGPRGIQQYLRPKNVTDFIFGYDVFISYARRDGCLYAARLQEELTKLDYRCFLDTSELPAGEQLGIALRRALRRSTVLVLLGSPGALNSPYVLQEVNGFKEYRPQGKILPISIGRTLDETEPGSSLRQALGDRVWITEDAEALTQAPTDRVRLALLQVFQFTRRNTWRLRITTAAGIVLGALAIISLILLVVAQRARLAAERQARISEIQRLAAQSGRVRDDFPQRSLLLAVEAETLARGDSATAQTPWAEQALRDELQKTAGIALPAPEAETVWGQIKQVTISPDGRWAVAIRDNEMAPLWDLAASDPSASVKTLSSEPGYLAPPITAATFTHDSQSLIVGQGSAVLLHDLANLNTEPRSLVTIPMNPTVNKLAITADRHWLAACVGEFKDCESLYLIDLRSREPTATSLISGKFMGDKINGLIISPDNHWLICAGEDKLIHFWNLAMDLPASQPHTI